MNGPRKFGLREFDGNNYRRRSAAYLNNNNCPIEIPERWLDARRSRVFRGTFLSFGRRERGVYLPRGQQDSIPHPPTDPRRV